MLNPNIDHRILLIDDQPFNAELLKSMLADESEMRIEYLSEPVRACEVADSFAPTLIMVDLHMPLVDGLSVIRALKLAPPSAQVPIIMLSSNENPHVKAEGFAAGAMDYLVKWPDRIELAARVRAHSRAYHAARERDLARQALETSQAALLERTRELAEAQDSLHDAQKMEAIGELTSGIAHDFNNVLQLINGHLQLLRVAHRTDEKTVRRVDAASEGVRRGARLASQLLAFARRQALEPVVMDAGAHLRSMECALHRLLSGRRLEMYVDAGVPMVSLDPVQFEKTVLHLVENAIEAMGPDGTLVFEVSLGGSPGDEESAAADYVCIVVRDDGTGMSDEVQRRAFEPFFTTRTGKRRSGLGLSLAFGFVKQSGGHIELSSAPGVGTTVSMYFPALAALEEDSVLAAEAPPRRVPTVLVVEDEASVRAASVEVLRKLGLYVLEAADGETALRLIRQGLPIDLLFTDIVMPGAVRGHELAEAMAEHLPEAKVLFASGYPGDVDREDGVFRRVQMLPKPYRLDEMSRVVQRLLQE